MMTWVYRIVLFMLLFGTSVLIYGGNSHISVFDKIINSIALTGIGSLVVFYFRLPPLYKCVAWLLGLGLVGLVLESKYEYGQFVYSYFVIKRFAYCGLALMAYAVTKQAGELKIQYAVCVIFAFFVINQLVLGQIFSYSFTSETRTVYSNETLYLIIPLLYYFVTYVHKHRIMDLLMVFFTFALIVILLHRSVISAAAVALVGMGGLVLIGKLSTGATGGFPLGRTVATITVILLLTIPLIGSLPENKVNGLVESLGGILDPKEDNTGSWRLEQSEHYLNLIPERPVLGWRYEGYDRGEVMVNEDFPEKGTIIHSQYIDMLYNYGAAGLAINLLLILGTLTTMYRRNRTFTTEQVVLFGFIVSGLVYAVSYQLPVFYWAFVGVGMYYGLKRPDHSASIRYPLPAKPNPLPQSVAVENQLNS